MSDRRRVNPYIKVTLTPIPQPLSKVLPCENGRGGGRSTLCRVNGETELFGKTDKLPCFLIRVRETLAPVLCLLLAPVSGNVNNVSLRGACAQVVFALFLFGVVSHTLPLAQASGMDLSSHCS